MKRAAIYVRVSTQEQKKHGLSVDNQIVALQEYCEKHGLLITDIYNDAGVSARKKYSKRPELLRLLEDCKAGKVDLILFTRLDRWFRSVADYYEVQAILDGCRVPWKTIWEDYSTETSEGVFKVNIMLSIAQAEADRTSEKIRSVFEYKKQKGDHLGSAPYGYILEDGRLIKDPEKREHVEIFFDELLNTMSITKARDKLHNMGVHLTIWQCKRFTVNPKYAGITDYSEIEPYITVEQFKLISDLRASHTRATKTDKVYLFAGLVKCGDCGKMLSGSFARMHSKPKGKPARVYDNYYYYYRCNSTRDKYRRCSVGSITEMLIERQLLAQLEPVLNQVNYERTIAAQQEDPAPKINQLTQRISRLGDRYELGDIDKAEYLKRREALSAELALLKNKPVNTAEPIYLPDDWRIMYDKMSKEGKKIFWQKILSYVTVNVDHTVSICIRS